MRLRKRRIRSRRDYLMAHNPDKRLRMLYNVRHTVGWLCVITILLFLATNLELLTPDSVKSIKISLDAASSAKNDTTNISLRSGSPDNVIPFGSGLAVCDNGELDIYLPGGYSQLTESLDYANPAMRTSDRYLLVFDRGANRFSIANTVSKLYDTTTSSPITDAVIADNGNVAIVTDEAGYKSAITVYNKDHEQVYQWKSPNYYIMSAALSADGERLAMFCFKQDGLNLTSQICFTDIRSSDSPDKGVDMDGSLCVGLKFLGKNTVCAVTDSGAYVVTRSGSIRYQLDYVSGDLLYFDMSDDDCAAICTTSYSQEGRAEITLLNSRGLATSNPLILASAPDSISYQDRRLAVLSGDTVTFYTRSLQLIEEQNGFSGASRVFMRSGNNCIALFSSNARILTIGKQLDDLNQISSADNT